MGPNGCKHNVPHEGGNRANGAIAVKWRRGQCKPVNTSADKGKAVQRLPRGRRCARAPMSKASRRC
eukprot:8683528-Pyramimonas_sp.AAC.1